MQKLLKFYTIPTADAPSSLVTTAYCEDITRFSLNDYRKHQSFVAQKDPADLIGLVTVIGGDCYAVSAVKEDGVFICDERRDIKV